jgi:hypothetical protein
MATGFVLSLSWFLPVLDTHEGDEAGVAGEGTDSGLCEVIVLIFETDEGLGPFVGGEVAAAFGTVARGDSSSTDSAPFCPQTTASNPTLVPVIKNLWWLEDSLFAV